MRVPIILLVAAVVMSLTYAQEYLPQDHSGWEVFHPVFQRRSDDVVDEAEVAVDAADPPRRRCTCEEVNKCGCCYNTLGFIFSKRTICLNFYHDEEKNKVAYGIAVNGENVFESPQIRPVICSPIPYIPLVSVCIMTTETTVDTGKYRTCAVLKMLLHTWALVAYDSYCFNVNDDGIYFDPVQQGSSDAILNIHSNGLFRVPSISLYNKNKHEQATT